MLAFLFASVSLFRVLFVTVCFGLGLFLKMFFRISRSCADFAEGFFCG